MRAQKFPTIAASLVASDSATKANRIAILQADERFLGLVVKPEEVEADLSSFYQTFKTFVSAAVNKIRNAFRKQVPGLPAGDYDDPAIPFSKYTVSKMPWSHSSTLSGLAGCGNLILAQLTGASPFEIKRFLKPLLLEYVERPENRHIDRTAMKSGSYIPSELLCAFLNLYNIQTIPITVRDLCPRSRLIENLITKEHVLLVSMHVAKKELTWCIYYQGHCFHNTEMNLNADCYDILNNPVQEMFLLYNPLWKLDMARTEDLIDDEFLTGD